MIDWIDRLQYELTLIAISLGALTLVIVIGLLALERERNRHHEEIDRWRVHATETSELLSRCVGHLDTSVRMHEYRSAMGLD